MERGLVIEIGPNLFSALTALIAVVNTALLAWVAYQNRREHNGIRREVEGVSDSQDRTELATKRARGRLEPTRRAKRVGS